MESTSTSSIDQCSKQLTKLHNKLLQLQKDDEYLSKKERNLQEERSQIENAHKQAFDKMLTEMISYVPDEHRKDAPLIYLTENIVEPMQHLAAVILVTLELSNKVEQLVKSDKTTASKN